MALQHVVLFSFPAEPTAEQAEEMRAQITGWVGVIPGIRALRFGEDITKARTRGYQFLLYMEFDTADDLRTYQAHPVHQQFLAWVIDNDITPLAFDYHLTDETVLLHGERAPLTKE
ncbi:MAG TPA: Dabb family protein [Jatrophihabitans sp.]|nr:Dabb family protein [Jatrophihabitans sp.]